MKKSFKAVILFLILVFVFVALFIVFKSLRKEDAKENFQIVEKSSGIIINGDYVTYVNIGDEYNEAGAIFYDENGNAISGKIEISYYDGNEQVFNIDTRYVNDYVVKYEFNGMMAKRVVIISDRISPKFEELKTKTITSLEAATYDVNDGVLAMDNSSKTTVKCDNSIGTLPGNYLVICKATDPYGNVEVNKRLIKVIEGITFNYKNGLEIKFPKGSKYIYKYSLDGGNTFINCTNSELIHAEGSVIAAVYSNDELVMSNTYYIN